MSLLVGLPESSGGRVRSYPSWHHHHHHHGCPSSRIAWGMNNRPVGDHGSGTVSSHHNKSFNVIHQWVNSLSSCFTPGKELSVTTQYETGWAPEPDEQIIDEEENRCLCLESNTGRRAHNLPPFWLSHIFGTTNNVFRSACKVSLLSAETSLNTDCTEPFRTLHWRVAFLQPRLHHASWLARVKSQGCARRRFMQVE
jgi:hypothetical protein